MRTIIRDNYTPQPGDYHDMYVFDEAKGKSWRFDCDGVFYETTIENELGDSTTTAASQHLATHIADGIDEKIGAEAELREAADNRLQGEIDDLKNSPDVVDIVDTYADLQAYDTSHLGDKDVIRVLADETHGGDSSYYRWSTSTQTWTYIGSIHIDERAFKPFPSSVVTDGTTQQFFNSILALQPEVGMAYLGTVELSDMPAGLIQEEVEVYVYSDYVVYGIMRSTDVEPYQWWAASYNYQGWLPIGGGGAKTTFYANTAETGTTRHIYSDVACTTAATAQEIYDASQDGLVVLRSFNINTPTQFNEVTLLNVWQSPSDNDYQFIFAGDGASYTYGADTLADDTFYYHSANYLFGDRVQVTGTSTTDIMSQNAVTSMVFASPSDETQIQIGAGAKSTGTRSISIFNDTTASSSWGVSSGIGAINLGAKAAAGARGIAIGEGAEVASTSAFGIALGGSSLTNNSYSIALGTQAKAYGPNSISIGHNVKDNSLGGNTAITIGSEIANNGARSIEICASGNASIGSNVQNAVLVGTAKIANSLYGPISIGGGQDNTTYNVVNNTGGVAIGAGVITVSGDYAVALGGWGATASGKGSVALGTYSSATSQGEVNIGSTTASYGYGNSNYRLLSGVYDGQSAHDAATLAQGNTLSSTAPTTSTEGVLGQLFTDTANGVLYHCTAIDTTDPNNPVYTWDTVGGGGGPTVVQNTGTSTTDVMSQNATTNMFYKTPNSGLSSIGIGYNTVSNIGSATEGNVVIGNSISLVSTNRNVMIGESTQGAASGSYCGTAVGTGAKATATCSVALGSYAAANTQGQLDVSTGSQTTSGYNSSKYRLITGVYDGQSAHDAATKGQLDSISIQNAGAPTTSTVGSVGQLLQDTTNGDLYICTAVDTTDPNNPVYTWEEVGSGGGGGNGIVTLTTADYNANSSNWSDTDPTNFNCVALWKLPSEHYYVWSPSVAVYATTTPGESANISMANYTTAAIIDNSTSDRVGIIIFSSSTANSAKSYTAKQSDGTATMKRWTPDLLTSPGNDGSSGMTQRAITEMIFADPSARSMVRIASTSNNGGNSIAIGKNSTAAGTQSVAIGYNSSISGNNSSGSVVIGPGASIQSQTPYSVAFTGGTTSTQGVFQIGLNSTGFGSLGYNNSAYRLLTGLYDPQSDHDAATKGYVDGVITLTDTDPGEGSPLAAGKFIAVYDSNS